jgi:hypothetical protein
MNRRIESLALIYQSCWLELGHAVDQREHPFRVLGLATVDGDAADLRLVVLREVQQAEHSLVFYTDARSPKVAQIQSHPQATLLAWIPSLGWQLRVRASLSVESSGLAVASRWARLKATPAAQDYLAPLPPGAPIERYEPERATRDHFAVVTARVSAIDWLELHPDGHRRARFDADGQGQWVSP